MESIVILAKFAKGYDYVITTAVRVVCGLLHLVNIRYI